MFYLKHSLQAWQTDNFRAVLKKEISHLNPDLLPLQQGLRYSSYALEDNVSSSILTVTSENENILVKVGLFYTGVIAGCNCADDPTPMDVNNEYCDVLFSINKKTAETTIMLVD